jgi:hypothetical protein
MGKARAVGEDQGVIRCPCRYNQSVGEMVQCEQCYVWQHFTCVGVRKVNVPELYLCERCSCAAIIFECPCGGVSFKKKKLKCHNLNHTPCSHYMHVNAHNQARSSKGIAKCFSCGKWQHLTCVGVSPSEMVDDYKCTNCREPSQANSKCVVEHFHSICLL